MNKPKISLKLSKFAQSYLRYVDAVFVGAGLVCAGLYGGVFGFVDEVNGYILATQLFHSLIRSGAAATAMLLLIDRLSEGIDGGEP